MEIMYNIGKIMITIFIGLAVLGISIVAIDGLTLKEMGTERAPCIDKQGDPFIDELCDKTIRCTWLGLIEERTCKEVRDSKHKRKEDKK